MSNTDQAHHVTENYSCKEIMSIFDFFQLDKIDSHILISFFFILKVPIFQLIYVRGLIKKFVPLLFI